MRRWLTIWLVTLLAIGATGGQVAAQYADVLLPQGVLQVTVEDLPINATTVPVVPVSQPRIAGSLGTGNITIDLAVADEAGNVSRFPSEVNRRGAFRDRVPEALTPGGTYSLYINDVLIGQFTISPDATGGETGDSASTATALDLARLVPFPQDAGDALPGLGLVPELSRYQPLAEIARLLAQNADNNTAEGRREARNELTEAGFVQRYQSSLAVAAEDDPNVFQIQIASIVTEYDSVESASNAYTASATGGEDVEGPQIGDESRWSRASAVATQTNAEYQALQLLFRQDKLLIVVNYADLLNRDPDQAVLESLAAGVQQRATRVLAAESNDLTVESLNIATGGVARSAAEQYYEAIDGALVPIFGETEADVTARLNNLTGATESAVSNLLSRGTPPEDAQANPATASPPFIFSVNMVSFADAASASAWMDSLPDRVAADPLPGYLTFAVVADAPSFGERSATYQASRQVAGDTASGYRSYVQVGDRIAIIELATVPESPDAAYVALVTAQVECLTAGGVCVAVNAPTELVPSSEGSGNETGGGGGQNNQNQGQGQNTDQGGGDGTNSGGSLPSGMERETPEAESQ